jgi:hypothetical protein
VSPFAIATRLVFLCAALVAFSACNGDQPSSPDITVFDRSTLIQGLRNQGASVEVAGSVSQPFFSVGGQILGVDGEDVQTFEYASEEDARAEAARVSPDGSTIGTTIVAWVAMPYFFRVGRVLALYVGDNQAALAPLEAVMGAPFAEVKVVIIRPHKHSS